MLGSGSEGQSISELWAGDLICFEQTLPTGDAPRIWLMLGRDAVDKGKDAQRD
jgi:hypothetical protein